MCVAGQCAVRSVPGKGDFLKPDAPNKANLETVADHVEWAARIGGAGCVAIGSDFDGIDRLPAGMQGVEDLPRLPETLARRGWSPAEIEAFCWENAARVLKHALPET